MSILKRQVNSYSSLFSVITHNSSVILQLMHFLLWTKGSYENTNFDIFKCSDENLPNSSCHFANHKSFFNKFYMTLHCHEIYSPVIFQVKRYILCLKGTSHGANFSDFLVLGSKFTKLLSFLEQKISFSSKFSLLFRIMRHYSSIFFLAEALYTLSKSSLSKYKFDEISSEQSKV